MDNKIKILFILPSLRPGGAERVVSFIAQHLDKTKFESKLLIIGFKKKAVYSFENIETFFCVFIFREMREIFLKF